MQEQIQSLLMEWEAVAATRTLTRDLAELCLTRRHTLSSFTVTMPNQISPDEMSCAPRRFEKKNRGNGIPSGPSRADCGSIKTAIEFGCDSMDEAEALAPSTGPVG